MMHADSSQSAQPAPDARSCIVCGHAEQQHRSMPEPRWPFAAGDVRCVECQALWIDMRRWRCGPWSGGPPWCHTGVVGGPPPDLFR